MQNEEIQNSENNYKIIAVDDEEGILDSLQVLLKRTGYNLVGVTDPVEAIERVKKEHFDLMILDFIMTPYHGDQVVEEIRKFDKDLYILLLTGHKDLAPPLETIKRLDIQGYCEKSDKFDQLMLLIESALKSIEQMREIRKINKELSETYDELEKAYLEIVETLRYTVEAKDTYTRGHSDRVSAYSVIIGEKLGLSEKDIKTLKIGGLFHDIGKIGIPDSILLKESKLTDDEYSQIKNHPSIGAHILSSVSYFKDMIPIVKHHHERYDGFGYPSKLKGEEIPYLARIAAVADSFDAMTSKRSYRNSLPLDVVIDEIERCKGTQFDPQIAEVFLDILKNEPEKIEEIQAKFNTEVAEKV
ncbi:MAG: HD domain-containing protein [Clostridia bacterium]|nr:HD domain-containing protein [Clostridia bacterium]